MSTDSEGANTYYIYGIGLIGSETPDGDYHTYHFDLRGSTTHITDMAGEVTDTFTYSSYGKLIAHTGAVDAIFQFNGQYGVISDGDGLLNMRVCYYTPDVGTTGNRGYFLFRRERV
jgi:Tol biopolymer transport system component